MTVSPDDLDGTTAQLARYVREELLGADDEACPHMEQLARMLASPEDEVAAAAASDHLEGCEICRLTVLAHLAATTALLDGELPSATRAAVGDAPTAPRKDRQGGQLPWPWMGGALAAAAAVMLALLASEPADRPVGQLVPKGQSASLHVGVRRGETTFELTSERRAEAGDALGFFYSSSTPTHLTILAVEANGQVTEVYSSTSHDGLLPPAHRGRLQSGAMVTASDRCEWLVGVFATEPLERGALSTALGEAARASSGDCELQMDLPSASSVTVLQVAP